MTTRESPKGCPDCTVQKVYRQVGARYRLGAIENKNATLLKMYQRSKTGHHNINDASYDVIAEAEAILANAALVSA